MWKQGHIFVEVKQQNGRWNNHKLRKRRILQFSTAQEQTRSQFKYMILGGLKILNAENSKEDVSQQL
jgi:hypothetical protein